MLRSVSVAPRSTHTATFIMLHGLGDSGHGWAPVAQMLSAQLPHVKFILPHAPEQRVTVNMDMRMPSWYDIYSFEDIQGREDEQGLEESVGKIDSIIQNELKSNPAVPSNRIVLGGFSQGAAVSLYASLSLKYQLGGIIALSGYLPLRHRLEKIDSSFRKSTPFLMCHGTHDEVVRFDWGKQSFNLLKKNGFESIDFKTYPGMGHSASDEEIRDIAVFLKKHVP